jgi:ankyrin repeat protein
MQGKTALFIALSNIKMLNILLDAGANVNILYNKKSPLCIAAEKGNLDMVVLLLKYGADINQTGTSSPVIKPL